MSGYADDLPDTTVELHDLPSRVGGRGCSYLRCGCTVEESCGGCDGRDAERAEHFRLLRRLRDRLDLANHRLTPSWRVMHGPDEGQEAAQAALDAVLDEIEAHHVKRGVAS